MITILCGQSKLGTENINCNATFDINDEANLTEAFYAFVKATEFEGYSLTSWKNLIEEISNPETGIDDNFNILDFLDNKIYNI